MRICTTDGDVNDFIQGSGAGDGVGDGYGNGNNCGCGDGDGDGDGYGCGCVDDSIYSIGYDVIDNYCAHPVEQGGW